MPSRGLLGGGIVGTAATHYRTGTGMVTAEWHVWVCLVPCFPLHVIHTTGLRRVPAGDELGRHGVLCLIPRPGRCQG